MINQVKNVFNSKVCEISILVIVCCMILTNLTIQHYGNWTDIAVIASLIGGITLLFLLIWAIIKLITRKEVKEMQPKPRFIIESISRLLSLVWIYITLGLIPAVVLTTFFLWDGITNVKRIKW